MFSRHSTPSQPPAAVPRLTPHAQAAAKNPSTQRFHYIAADASVEDYSSPLIASAIAWNGGVGKSVV